MTTQQVYEAFYERWREAEKQATEEGKDIQQERSLWPSLGEVQARACYLTKENRSRAAVRYHLQKLMNEGLIRSEWHFTESFYPVGLFFTEIERAQL